MPPAQGSVQTVAAAEAAVLQACGAADPHASQAVSACTATQALSVSEWRSRSAEHQDSRQARMQGVCLEQGAPKSAQRCCQQVQ